MSASSNNRSVTNVSSDQQISQILSNGFTNIILYTGTGLVFGFGAGIVLATRGGGITGRKAFTGLGGGLGFGSAWTNTSIQIENLLSSKAGVNITTTTASTTSSTPSSSSTAQ